MQPIQEVKGRSPVMAIIAFILLVVLGAFVYFSTQKNTSAPIRPNRVTSTVPTVTPRPVIGTMTISSSGGARFSKSSPVTLQVQASSQGRQVVGYDVVVTYDKAGFDFVKATSLMEDFKIYSYDRPTYVSLSAIKSLQDNKVATWTNQALVDLTFQPKKAGTFSFSLAPVGKEASKLVDEKAEGIYPSTGQLQLEVF
ncbi:hypothetical protein HZC27_01630 [Candidatus Roizmanbacteria bacterium]|nr:hypothetical protein [Candidatus Roizmanbacteria bacterium]